MGNQMIFKRYELKYLITRQQRDKLLVALAPFLETDKYAHSSIRNLYYDTPSWRLIRGSLDRPMYKEKLRVRGYGRCGKEDEIFVELKKKYDSIVYKRRISLPQEQALSALAGAAPLPDSQIGKEIRYALGYYKELAPRVFLSYERDSFHARDGSECRVTFDDEIRYRTTELTLDSECWGDTILPEDMVLMEIKLSDAMPLWMARELSELGIQKTTFSKYGAAYQQMQCKNTKGEKQYA